jgi:hypothetical protein
MGHIQGVPSVMTDPSLESYIYALDDHLQYFRLSVRCQKYDSIFEHNLLKIANFPFHPLTVSRKITNEILKTKTGAFHIRASSQLVGLGAELWSPEKVTHYLWDTLYICKEDRLGSSPYICECKHHKLRHCGALGAAECRNELRLSCSFSMTPDRKFVNHEIS